MLQLRGPEERGDITNRGFWKGSPWLDGAGLNFAPHYMITQGKGASWFLLLFHDIKREKGLCMNACAFPQGTKGKVGDSKGKSSEVGSGMGGGAYYSTPSY